MFIFQDWEFNNHDLRIRFVLILFRVSQILWQKGGFVRILSLPYFIIYRVLVMYVFHIELMPNLEVGKRLRLFHGYALVIHPSSVIGDDVTLRHCTTLGNKNSGENGPKLGDRVNIGCNSVILGSITIGDGAVIGAGSVVINDVAPNEYVAGNPAKVIERSRRNGFN